MADIAPAEVFYDSPNPGSEVTAARLNNFLGNAVINKEFVSGKSIIAPATGDYLPFYDVSGDGLGKATLQTLVQAVGGDGTSAAGVAALRILGTTSVQAAAGNDTRFPASVTGPRKGAGAGSADTAALKPDFAQAPSVVTGSGTGTASADCSVNTWWTYALPASTTGCTLTFNNVPNGIDIRLVTTQGASSASTLTLVFNSGNGSGTLTKLRLGGAGAITASTNAVDRIDGYRFGSTVQLEYKLAFA